jgi:hypothetical protein
VPQHKQQQQATANNNQELRSSPAHTFNYRSTVVSRPFRSLTLVGASDKSQVFFVQEVLKSWFSAV